MDAVANLSAHRGPFSKVGKHRGRANFLSCKTMGQSELANSDCPIVLQDKKFARPRCFPTFENGPRCADRFATASIWAWEGPIRQFLPKLVRLARRVAPGP